MADATTQWFRILTFAGTTFIVGFSISNLMYYKRIADGNCAVVTEGEANSMIWINVAILVIALIIWFFSLYKLIINQDQPQGWQTGVYKVYSPDEAASVNTTSVASNTVASNPVVSNPVVSNPPAVTSYSRTTTSPVFNPGLSTYQV